MVVKYTIEGYWSNHLYIIYLETDAGSGAALDYAGRVLGLRDARITREQKMKMKNVPTNVQ